MTKRDLISALDALQALGNQSSDSLKRTLHDLQVHEIELEMQNRELRETQLLLEYSRDRYSDLYDFAPIGYLTLDERGVIQEINLTAASILETNRGDLDRVPFFLFLNKSDQPLFREHLKESRATNGRVDTELRLRGKSGKEVTVQLYTTTLTDPRTGHLNYNVALINLTDTRRVERALWRSEEDYRAIFENAVEGIYRSTREGRFLKVNPAAAAMFGYDSPEEMIHSVNDIGHQLFVDPHDRLRLMDEVEKHQLRRAFRAQARKKNGELIWVSVTARVVRDKTGEVRYFEGIIEDITERHLLAQQLELASRRREEDLHRFAASVQHAHEGERKRIARELHDDLGQRLAGIKLGMQVLAEDLRAGGRGTIKELRKLKRQIDEAISEVRRISSGLRPTVLDHFGLVPALERLCAETQNNSGIIIRMDAQQLEPLDEQVEIVAYRIAQEALTNIIKHSQARNATVRVSSTGEHLRIVITDDGEGFEPDRLRESVRGSGFGLLNMKERAEFLHGTCTVTSSPGKGTSLTIEIPRHPHENSQKDSHPSG